MSPEKEQEYCEVCEHRIVHGVACNGVPRECAHPQPAAAPEPHPRNAVAVDSFFDDDEYDAVRGLD